MTGRMKKSQMDGLLGLLALGVFAVCLLAVLLTGADAYRRLAERDETAYDRRTAAQYLATKVRQADSAQHDIRVDAFWQDGTALSEGNTLLLSETIDDAAFETRLYCYDGYLRELFSPSDGAFAPSDGEKILPAQRVEFDCQGALLTAKLTLSGGETQQVVLYTRSGEGAAA